MIPMSGLLAVVRSRLFGLVWAVVGIAVPLAWLWTLVGPSEDAVKLRSALILSMGVPADFQWAPQSVPGTFIQNKSGVPQDFERVAASIDADTPSLRQEISRRHWRSRGTS
jgi:hypothetical protein